MSAAAQRDLRGRAWPRQPTRARWSSTLTDMRFIGRILGFVGLGWVVWRLLGPDLAPEYHGVQERPLKLPGRSVFVGPREFFVRESGPVDAPVVVLVHGWSFDGEMTYFRVIPQLAERYRVIVPDLRDHGKTDRIRGRFEIADLAEELMERLKIGPRDMITILQAINKVWEL